MECEMERLRDAAVATIARTAGLLQELSKALGTAEKHSAAKSRNDLLHDVKATRLRDIRSDLAETKAALLLLWSRQNRSVSIHFHASFFLI